jgi:pyruvate/2-oxoglutarate dehydrogenase complex dihydrolipoamide dehydrogenase (E3) component
MTPSDPSTPPYGSILPNDQFNRDLLDNVHPPQWKNPTPTGRYNLVVIGAGTAGLVTAAIASALGAKVALIERHLMGGDCLNVGCVPSKGILRAANAWASVRDAEQFGLYVPENIKRDFGAAMARMRKIRSRISHMDSAHRFTTLGVDVFIGTGRFTGSSTIDVDGTTLEFAKAVICTGARASAPPIPGLTQTAYLTNETVFSLTELPPRFGIIGAGPIGCEMAQAFARFGSQVFLVEALHGMLPNEDRDAAEVVERSLRRDGVQLLCCGKDLVIKTSTDGTRHLSVDSHGRHYDIPVDEILVGTGRSPNVEDLSLETVGVEFDSSGVTVNHRLQTSNPRIFAAGDICSPFKFTHTADAQAQIVIQNALFPHPFGLGYASTETLVIPWATYTQPELAHVGLYAKDAQAQNIPIDTFTFSLNEVDRAILDGEEEGFARVHVKKGTDTIVGATIVAAHAGDLISEMTLAMKGGLGLNALAGTIYPYPTQAEVVKKAANAWRKTTLTPRKKQWLMKLFAWTR